MPIMCDLGGKHDHFGFLVDTPEIRALVDETERLRREVFEDADRVERLKPIFARLLSAEGWLPDAYARPDSKSGMGGGIGQYALYRASDGSLCLFSLVIPPGARTPVHDHLAWGLVGLYRGTQDEELYEPGDGSLRRVRQRPLQPGDYYTLLPPREDIHRVRTTSDVTSVSIHLLANDTGCVARHTYDEQTGAARPFRSGYVNADCEDGPIVAAEDRAG